MSKNASESSGEAFFEPPPGGDITLHSSDGTNFRAHSTLMSLASSVFRDMLSVGVPGDGLINLTEDAESISLMLKYIYPIKSPNLYSIDEYATCLEIARKYDMKGMTDTLNEQLCWGERNEVVKAKPIEACILADAFGLRNASEVAARVVDHRFDLRDTGELADGLGRFPKWKLPVRLVGMQAARAEALTKILFNFDSGVMSGFATCDNGRFPLCRVCDEQTSDTQISVPTWLLRWSMGVYNLALKHNLKALSEEAQITNPDSVPRLINDREGEDRWSLCCNSCIEYVQSCKDYPSWADAVVNEIEIRFSELSHDLSLL